MPRAVHSLSSAWRSCSRARGPGVDRATLKRVLEALAADYEGRGIEVGEVSSGYRIQIRRSVSDWLVPLWEEKAPRYTRALLETLALVAYRQPITRAEIEEVRGVVVSTNIMRTLLERGWVRVVACSRSSTASTVNDARSRQRDRVGGRHVPQLGPRLDREQLDLEPVPESGLVGPDGRDLGHVVPGDQSLRPSARSSLNRQRAACTSGSPIPTICAASTAAFTAASTPTVATGTPVGICAVIASAS